MGDDEIPQRRDLPNKPLVEAIFELRWALQSPDKNLPPQDPGFRFALGRYYDSVRGQYPVAVDLPLAQLPEAATPHSVRHQFWAGKNTWPVTQLGPGILTVNETEAYTWHTFRDRVIEAVDAIFRAYPTDITPLKPTSVRLRYIDGIPFDPDKTNPLAVLSDFLHTNVRIDPLLFDDPHKPGAPVRANLNLTIPLREPAGRGTISFSTGTRVEKPAIIMEILVRSDASDVPMEKAAFEAWVDQAHDVVSRWFFTLCRGRLLESYEEKA